MLLPSLAWLVLLRHLLLWFGFIVLFGTVLIVSDSWESVWEGPRSSSKGPKLHKTTQHTRSCFNAFLTSLNPRISNRFLSWTLEMFWSVTNRILPNSITIRLTILWRLSLRFRQWVFPLILLVRLWINGGETHCFRKFWWRLLEFIPLWHSDLWPLGILNLIRMP